MQTQALIEHLNAYLNAASFKDYAPNGLQVEGKPEIHRIVLGVSASQALIDHACSMGRTAFSCTTVGSGRASAPKWSA